MLAATVPPPAMAQQGPSLEASLASDYRERGLSWSDGKAVAQLYIDVPLPSGFFATAQATTLRGGARHSGADAGFDLRVGHAGDTGLLYWRGGVTGHVFAGGHGPLDYIEGDVRGGVMIGPADVSLTVSYAPPQKAIGGSNFHGRVNASLALPGTPLTLNGHFGRSTGSIDNPLRATRLRPGGKYHDWGLGLDYNRGPLRFSLDYVDTDIGRSDIRFPETAGHRGAALVAGAHMRF